MLAPCALDRDVRETSPRVRNEMHPLVRRIDRYVGAEAALESTNQHVALIPIQQAHSTNMRCEVPLFHESGNDGLAQGRWLSVHKIAGGNERPQQRTRHHGITDPQAWKERLVERADINDTLTPIEPLKRG